MHSPKLQPTGRLALPRYASGNLPGRGMTTSTFLHYLNMQGLDVLGRMASLRHDPTDR